MNDIELELRRIITSLIGRIPNCPACFDKYCECKCATCIEARERNSKLSEHELKILNLQSAGVSRSMAEDYLSESKRK